MHKKELHIWLVIQQHCRKLPEADSQMVSAHICFFPDTGIYTKIMDKAH
jgi:hypothetical protein